jgi:hypothetical protein
MTPTSNCIGFATNVYSHLDSIKMAQHNLMVRWIRQFGAGTSSSDGHDDDSDDAPGDGDGDGDDAPIEE